MFACSSAFAAGLGRLNVRSALGQPLDAEVEIPVVDRDEVLLIEGWRLKGDSTAIAPHAVATSIRPLPNFTASRPCMRLKKSASSNGSAAIIAISVTACAPLPWI